MNKTIDDNLTDLSILGSLPEGVKISVRSGRIVLERPKGVNVVQDVMCSLKRWMYSDTRKSGIDEVYSIVTKSIELVNSLGPENHNRKMYMKVFPLVIVGIENYKRTYSDDPFIRARCDIIMNNVQPFCQGLRASQERG